MTLWNKGRLSSEAWKWPVSYHGQTSLHFQHEAEGAATPALTSSRLRHMHAEAGKVPLHQGPWRWRQELKPVAIASAALVLHWPRMGAPEDPGASRLEKLLKFSTP